MFPEKTATDLDAFPLPKPSERTAIVSFILIFLCGAVLGALVMSFYGHPGLRAPAHSPAAAASGLSMNIDEWKQKLDLTPDQTVALTSILDDFSHYYDNVLADGNTRILQILNPEQRTKFEKMLREHKH